MEFNNISADNPCNCIENANEDNENLYAIKTMKDVLRVQDFNSYWEKGKRPANNECKEICSLKGVSISLFNDETKNDVVEIYKELFPLAPRYKPHLSIIKFYESSGMVRHTPIDLNIHLLIFIRVILLTFLK